MKYFKLMHLALCIALLMTSAALVEAAKAPGSPDSVKIKPDIQISDLKINRISVVPAGHNVQIEVTVVNPVKNTGTGPFKVQVEWTADPSRGFNFLASGGVASLDYNSASVTANNRKTLTFNHQVPTGQSYKYRVTADYLNQVDEADESNNIASAGYIAR
jgi:hypothetical protein